MYHNYSYEEASLSASELNVDGPLPPLISSPQVRTIGCQTCRLSTATAASQTMETHANKVDTNAALDSPQPSLSDAKPSL